MIDFSGKVHGGAIILVYLYVALGNEQLDDFLNPFWMWFGALFPDSDHRAAPMGRLFQLWRVCKHRGWTHSIEALAIFTGCVGLFDVGWAISFGIGFLSHLLLDAITPSGVQWIWLARKKKNPFRFLDR